MDSKTKCFVAINEVDFASTGSIAISLLNKLKNEGNETLLVCHESLQRYNHEYIINKGKIGYLKNKILSRFDASDGFHSKGETKKLIKHLGELKPDCLLLGNLHGSYINLPILFSYIKEQHINCIWTLHDCWPFTGKCAHFTYEKCDKWKTCCHHCPALKEHPRAYFFDHSKNLYLKKKALFEGMENYLTFVSPSKWMDSLLGESYLKNFKHVVINNGIDVNQFRKIETNNKKPEYLKDKKIILCCANVFTERKGINDILKLSNLISSDERILVVGDLKKKVDLPSNVIHIKHTNNVSELIDIYSWSDVFFNPTYEDNYPTVNLESSACKLPIVCYLSGGASEVVDEHYTVQPGDIEGAYQLMKNIFNNKSGYIFPNVIELSKDKMLEKYEELIKEAIK